MPTRVNETFIAISRQYFQQRLRCRTGALISDEAESNMYQPCGHFSSGEGPICGQNDEDNDDGVEFLRVLGRQSGVSV